VDACDIVADPGGPRPAGQEPDVAAVLADRVDAATVGLELGHEVGEGGDKEQGLFSPSRILLREQQHSFGLRGARTKSGARSVPGRSGAASDDHGIRWDAHQGDSEDGGLRAAKAEGTIVARVLSCVGDRLPGPSAFTPPPPGENELPRTGVAA